MKIAIIGGGTVGGLTAGHWNRWSRGEEIEWIISPDIAPVTVGEGTTRVVPAALDTLFKFSYSDLEAVGGTVKLGIIKEGWGNGARFINPFSLGQSGIHMTATKLHDWMRDKLSGSIKITDKTISSHDDVEADYIVDCTGTPKDFGDAFHKSESIPVNAVYVTQCPWDSPQFLHSLTIGRPYGWVFGIPLQNRCAIGYLYNKDINTLQEVKEDVKNIFDQFKLTPSDQTLSLSFGNYRRKQNFHDRGYYNGNASFFLEPLEATSLSFATNMNSYGWSRAHESMPPEIANQWYTNHLFEIETMIMTHYIAKSKFNTPFWDHANERAARHLEKAAQTSRFRELVEKIRHKPKWIVDKNEYGAWYAEMWIDQLQHLGIFDTFVGAVPRNFSGLNSHGTRIIGAAL